MAFWEQIPQQLVNSLWLGGVYMLFALGYTLVFGVIKELNLAHGGIFMWGAYAGLMSVTQLKLPLVPSLVIAMAGAGVLGILLERLAYKPLRELTWGTGIIWLGFILFLISNFRIFSVLINRILLASGIAVILVGFAGDYLKKFRGRIRKPDYLAPLISSIGAGSIMAALSQNIFGAQQSRFPVDIIPHHVYSWGSITISRLQITIILFSFLLAGALSWFVFRTKTGLAMRAVSSDKSMSALLGIRVNKVYLVTFFLSSALAGAAGVLHGLAFNAVTPYMGAPVQLKGLTVIVLGGLGSIKGAIAGGLIVALLEVFSVAVGQSNFRDAIVYFLLFIMLLIRPQGILGKREIDKV